MDIERQRLKLEAEKAKSKTVFDVAKNIKLVPLFFERVAANFAWPKENWISLLQCVLSGKGQEIYSCLPLAKSLLYDDVMGAS